MSCRGNAQSISASASATMRTAGTKPIDPLAPDLDTELAMERNAGLHRQATVLTNLHEPRIKKGGSVCETSLDSDMVNLHVQ